jgi:ABC-type Zn uptake system ZnuABC Zn-binding protein ZnuA
MSIRALALDLYKAQQQVDRLQKALSDAAPTEKDSVARELRAAQSELKILRKMLDGEKESGSFRKKFSGYGG